jgi:hypothetical protein
VGKPQVPQRPVDKPDSNAVYRLLQLGLVVVEHDDRPDYFMIMRPASVPGSSFRGREGCHITGMGRAQLSTNAPAATLKWVNTRWLVDISEGAAPGPGPVWFQGEFVTCQDAVDAIEGCYFGDRVDNNNESLERWFGDRQP